MEQIRIETLADFRRWVRVQMAYRDTNSAKLAKQMGIPYPRISEALHGKRHGKKFVVPLIEILGGDVDDFKAII